MPPLGATTRLSWALHLLSQNGGGCEQHDQLAVVADDLNHRCSFFVDEPGCPCNRRRCDDLTRTPVVVSAHRAGCADPSGGTPTVESPLVGFGEKCEMARYRPSPVSRMISSAVRSPRAGSMLV